MKCEEIETKHGEVTAFQQRIIELRGDKTQQEVANMLVGIHKNTWWRWEKGHSEPDIATLVQVSQVFDVSLDWLLGVSSLKRPISRSETESCFPRRSMKKQVQHFKQKAELAVEQANAFLKTVEEIEEDL